jgi:hypothetical protein
MRRVRCRPVPSAGKIGGWISVIFTLLTLFNSTIMFLFKPEVLKYRAMVGHMVVKVAQGATQRLVPSELLGSPDSKTARDDSRPTASAVRCTALHGCPSAPAAPHGVPAARLPVCTHGFSCRAMPPACMQHGVLA